MKNGRRRETPFLDVSLILVVMRRSGDARRVADVIRPTSSVAEGTGAGAREGQNAPHGAQVAQNDRHVVCTRVRGAIIVGETRDFGGSDRTAGAYHRHMQHRVVHVLRGGLKRNDPRRFLIEAMIGSMKADGMADPREVDVVEKQVASHVLFGGMDRGTAKTLIDVSNDAIKFARSAIARAPAIAKGLPARIHRLAAFGMAAEVADADRVWHAKEGEFLETLRIQLRIPAGEADLLLRAAKAGLLANHLDEKLARLQQLVPAACEVFALRALARGAANGAHRTRVRDFFLALPDLSGIGIEALDAELAHAFARSRGPDASVYGELARLGAALPDPVDRYWLVVYALVAEPSAGVIPWQQLPFVVAMRAAFRIADVDMQFAVSDAQAFGTAMPRPD